MKSSIVFCLLFFHTLFISANNEIRELLIELDQTISSGELYTDQKEKRLKRLKEQLEREASPSKQYELNYDIIEEYKSYKCDSALFYISKALDLARREKNTVWEARTRIQNSQTLSSAALFRESEDNLQLIPVEELDDKLKVEYYKCGIQLYINQSAYLNEDHISTEHAELVRNYRDSIYHYLPPNSAERKYYQSQFAEAEDDYDTAIALLSEYIQKLHPETHEYAKMNYSLANYYSHKGETEKRVKHIIIAAITDKKDAIKENLALLTLATWLYEQNDISRAYRYIQTALDDANYYNARLRNFQIAQTLPIINNAYQKHKDQQSFYLKLAFISMSILFLILLGLALYLNKQRKTLSRIRIKLKESNTYLEQANGELYHVNRELSESNLVKEEYIGHFINLYSGYIAKMEEYRKMINNKIAAKRFDELVKMASAPRGKDTEVKELYINFDKAFLSIYPGFVSSFNQLLKEEERFDIKKGELLNTELRVFALIRLGINDSTKIADFLRCSLQTVYNYRSKIKKKSIHEEEDIESLIHTIGNFKEPAIK